MCFFKFMSRGGLGNLGYRWPSRRADSLRDTRAIITQDVAGTEQPAQFLTNVAAIEEKTGLDFFSELPKVMQEQLEVEVAKGMWSSPKQHGAKNKHLRPTR